MLSGHSRPSSPALTRSPPSSRGWFPVLAASVLLWSLGGGPAQAQLEPAAQRGLTFVRVHCAQCHAIDMASESPLTIAPPFRTLHQRLSIDGLERRLSEGIMATHPTMPQFRLDPDQVTDVVAYLRTLQR
jgi:cytochrome c